MASRTVLVSDITGQDITEEERVTCIIREHPSIESPVKLDAADSELEELRNNQAGFAIIEVVDGDGEAERLVVWVDTFNGLINGDVDELLSNAEKATGTTRARKAGGERINYGTIEHAGEVHRGKVTEEEAKLVRENLEKVNERLASLGQRTIDPSDPKMAERYGFTTE